MQKKYLKVVEVAIEHEDKFLIIQRPSGVHAGGLLAFPGGKVEKVDESDDGDILRAAAKREILEEVGLVLKDNLDYVVSSYFVSSDTGDHVIDSIFHCKVKKTTLKISVSKREVVNYYWMTAAEIDLAANCPAWLKKNVQDIQKL